MLQAQLIDNEIVTTGEVQEGDVYPDLCCAGYGYIVDLILDNAYGHCSNPDHVYRGDIPYRDGIHEQDIALALVDGGEAGR